MALQNSGHGSTDINRPQLKNTSDISLTITLNRMTVRLALLTMAAASVRKKRHYRTNHSEVNSACASTTFV